MSTTAPHEAALKAVFQRVFKLDPRVVTDRTKRGSIESWDSLGHLELIEALQKDFGITIPPEEALEMETFADVRRVVAKLAPSGTR
jgi:acyl carrier protein